ncbi:hypothetical protein NOVOSPHI9U_770028 [Novosphingobium sp. 9U]|nr:hypothetical protein NOVOSPHI9U_770028 [Novosphingobium sp. 9U]
MRACARAMSTTSPSPARRPITRRGKHARERSVGPFNLPSRLREGPGEGLFAKLARYLRQALPKPLPQAGGAS